MKIRALELKYNFSPIVSQLQTGHFNLNSSTLLDSSCATRMSCVFQHCPTWIPKYVPHILIYSDPVITVTIQIQPHFSGLLSTQYSLSKKPDEADSPPSQLSGTTIRIPAPKPIKSRSQNFQPTTHCYIFAHLSTNQHHIVLCGH